jgi:hypothetical protein
MLDRQLPCLIRALPAVTGRDQLVCRNRHLVSHHFTAISSARYAQQLSRPNSLYSVPSHNAVTIQQLRLPTQLPSKLHPGPHTLGT